MKVRLQPQIRFFVPVKLTLNNRLILRFLPRQNLDCSKHVL
jgi:hypothetical protein